MPGQVLSHKGMVWDVKDVSLAHSELFKPTPPYTWAGLKVKDQFLPKPRSSLASQLPQPLI